MVTDIEILRKAYERESDSRIPVVNGGRSWQGFQVGLGLSDIHRFKEEGLIEITFKAEKGLTKYRLTDKGRNLALPDVLEEKMERIAPETIIGAMVRIVGFDDVKETIAMAISSKRKINILLEGPPACSKSLLMEGVRNSVPQSYMAFGSRTSGAGLSDILFENKPSVLLIDELEKMRHDVFSVLLGLMERGEVIETKKGNALRNGMKVYTPVGPKSIETLKVGDFVYAVDGEAAQILGIFPQGKQGIYGIEFSDGQVIYCTKDHLWEIKRHNIKEQIVDTAELLSYSPRLLSRTWVPVVASVQFAHRPVPMDAYAVGALIGDGGLTREVIHISTVDNQILRRIETTTPNGYSFKKKTGDNSTYTLTRDKLGGEKRHPWITSLRGLGLWGKHSYEKFIPEIYKYNSEEVRWALIQGMMDTDGSATLGKHGGQPIFWTSCARLADDFAEVVESLGGICTINSKPASYVNKRGKKINCRMSYRVRVTHPYASKFFLLDRKRAQSRNKAKPMRRYIDAIHYLGQDEATCIEVDHPRHLFLTEGFIPTHNTRGIVLKTIVIGACNKSDKMPPEFLSRFSLHVHFPAYTRDEFMDVCRGILTQVGCPEELAEYIGRMVYDLKLGDIRSARGVWDLVNAPTREEVERVIHLKSKYSKKGDNNLRIL